MLFALKISKLLWLAAVSLVSLLSLQDYGAFKSLQTRQGCVIVFS